MALKRYHDNLFDYDTDQEDLTVENVGEILDAFEANVFNKPRKKSKICKSATKRLKIQQRNQQRDTQMKKGGQEQERPNSQRNAKPGAKQKAKGEIES